MSERSSAEIERQIAHWIRAEIRDIGAYHVADASGLVKLDAMENPYGFPGSLVPELKRRLDTVAVNRYPDPEARGIRALLRKRLSLTNSHEILFGNGSDELIQILMLAVGGPGRTVLAVEPSFVMYRMTSLFTQTRYQAVPLNPDFSINESALLQAIDAHHPALTFLAQPNNPTGNLFDRGVLERVIQASTGLVVIDEAYMAFTDSNCLPWLERYPNLLIMRTFSKVGLAGLRFGMLFGERRWIEELNKVRMPYNINNYTQAAIELVMEHYELFAAQCEEIRETRRQLMAELSQWHNVEVFPSEANFVLIRLSADIQAKQVFAELRDRHRILVKCLDGSHPLLSNCLRLTVGSEEENLMLLTALEDVLRPGR